MPDRKNHSFTNQHIVPRFYLNNFATNGDRNKKHRIGVLQKDLKHFITSTDNVGYIKNYYDIEFLDNKKMWEHYFSKKIEAPCNNVIKNLISSVNLSRIGSIVISENDQIILSRFIITQFLRVPQFIEYQIESATKSVLPSIKHELLSKYSFLLSKEKIDALNRITFSRDQFKHIILSCINNPKKLNQYCNFLISKPWVIYVNKFYKYIPFITSDNPVVMNNLSTKSFSRSDNGIGNPNTVIFFPINPSIAIGIYPHSYNLTLLNWNRKSMILGDNDCPFIKKMNECELSQCYNQSYVSLDFYNYIFQEEHHK